MMTINVKNKQFKQGVCLTCTSRDSLLCVGLSDEFLPELCCRSTQKQLRKGETLFYEGDAADHVFNVKSGFMRVARLGEDGRRHVLAFLGQGDYLGHTNRPNYVYSAEALTDVQLCQFTRSSIDDLEENYPEFKKQFNRLTACLLDEMTDLLFTIGRKNAIERVASFLIYLRDKQKGKSQRFAEQIWLPMTRADIADFLGLTLETVSRAISRLKREGLIMVDQAHQITILRPEALSALSRGAE